MRGLGYPAPQAGARKTRSIALDSRGADVLIHEGYNKDLVNRVVELESEVPDQAMSRQLFRMARLTQHYHTSRVEAAELAAEARVPTLAHTHIIPPLGHRLQSVVLRQLFTKGPSSVFGGKVIIAKDDMHLTLAPSAAAD